MSGALINCGPSRAGSSFYGPLMRCGQLWAYQTLLGLDGISNREALDKGSLMHVWLAHHYRRMQARQAGQDPDQWMTPDDAVRAVVAQGEIGDHVALVLETGARYAAEYVMEDRDVTVVAVEEEVEGRIPAPPGSLDFQWSLGDHGIPLRDASWAFLFRPVDWYLFTLRIDLRLQDRHGKIWCIDHKTSQYMKTDTLEAFALDVQFLGLAAFGQALYGERFGGVFVNVINWSVKGSGKFNRPRLAWAPWGLSRFLGDMAERRSYMTRLAAEGRDPWRFPPVFHNLGCRHVYGMCDFLEQCKHGPGGE